MSSYGFSVVTPKVTDDQLNLENLADHAAWQAFTAGHQCKSKGKDASPFIKALPVRLHSQARTYFAMLGGNHRFSHLIPQAHIDAAKALRAKALQA